MSEVKVNKISPRTACGTTTLGDSGDTFTIPAGVSITNNGTASGFGATGSASWVTTKKTATFTATAGEGYFLDTTSGQITVNLPAGTAGAVVGVKDYAGTFDTNKATLNLNGSDKLGGLTTNASLTTEGQAVTLVFVDSTQGWLVTDSGLQSDASQAEYIAATGGNTTITCGDNKIHIFTGPGTLCVSNVGNPQGSDKVEYLVVSGGGGGAASCGKPGGAAGPGGGGGGGGNPGGSHPSGGSAPGTAGESGDTNTGGGGGSSFDGVTGAAGGSGVVIVKELNRASGMFNLKTVFAARKSDTWPDDTKFLNTDLDYLIIAGGGAGAGSGGLGGGGGAGAVGGDGTNVYGGNGGIGRQDSITGTATYYAGGGGGGVYTSNNFGQGGQGGGGNGTDVKANNNGTANTGGGGGGSCRNLELQGNGGSGICILKIPTTSYSGTTTGSPTVTTDGDYTILTYTSSGTYTG